MGYEQQQQPTTLFLAARLPPLSIWPKPPGTVGGQPDATGICLRSGLRPSTPHYVAGRECHFCVTPLASVTIGTGIFNRFAIAFACQLRLRSRLTLIRLALIRNPWVFGGRVSRPSYRYSCLQFRFHKIHGASQRPLLLRWNAPLPLYPPNDEQNP